MYKLTIPLYSCCDYIIYENNSVCMLRVTTLLQQEYKGLNKQKLMLIKTNYIFKDPKIMENFVNFMFPTFTEFKDNAIKKIKEKGSVEISFNEGIVGAFDGTCPVPQER